MAVTNARSQLVVAVAVAAVLLLASCSSNAELQDCRGGGNLIAKCRDYVLKGLPKKPPSNDCCRALRAADLPCLCKQLPPSTGAILDIGKVCYVGRTCKVSMPPAGTKCGGE